MAEQTDTRPVAEIVESEIGSRAYLALHISDVQASAGNLYEALEDEPGIDPEFRDLLLRVAQWDVRIRPTLDAIVDAIVSAASYLCRWRDEDDHDEQHVMDALAVLEASGAVRR